MPTPIRALTGVHHTDTGLVHLLGAHDLDPLHGQVDRFATADLTWPGPPPGTAGP